jgi:hypothetical protein
VVTLDAFDEWAEVHVKADILDDDVQAKFPDMIPPSTDREDRDALEAAVSSVLQLSGDEYLTKQGARDLNVIPLAGWKYVKHAEPCAHAKRGLIVHGGPMKLVDVCTNKRCVVHWASEQKAKKAEEKQREQRREGRTERQAVEDTWQKVEPLASTAIRAHVEKTVKKLTLKLVKDALGYQADQIGKTFGVKLSDKTALHVLALAPVEVYSREVFAAAADDLGFNLAKWEKKQQAAKKATPATKAKKGGKQ